jgi:hypothetical protein
MIKWMMIIKTTIDFSSKNSNLFFYLFSDKFLSKVKTTTVIIRNTMSSAPSTQIANDIITPNDTIIHSSEIQPPRFDLKTLRDAFADCIQPDNTLLLREYIRAYDELCM